MHKRHLLRWGASSLLGAVAGCALPARELRRDTVLDADKGGVLIRLLVNAPENHPASHLQSLTIADLNPALPQDQPPLFLETRQMGGGTYLIRPNDTVIIRPDQLGGSYVVPRTTTIPAPRVPGRGRG